MMDRLLNIIPNSVPGVLMAPVSDWDSIPDWAKSSAYVARVLKIVRGDENGAFNPNAPITRQEMFLMVYRALRYGFGEVDHDLWRLPQYNHLISYPHDREEIADWALYQIAYLYTIGIVKGVDGDVHPRDAATRAEAAQILYNLLEYDRG